MHCKEMKIYSGGGSGIQIHGKIPFKAECVEFILKEDWQPIFSETWIQFTPERWEKMQLANARLMATSPKMLNLLERCLVIIQSLDEDSFPLKIENEIHRVVNQANGRCNHKYNFSEASIHPPGFTLSYECLNCGEWSPRMKKKEDGTMITCETEEE